MYQHYKRFCVCKGKWQNGVFKAGQWWGTNTRCIDPVRGNELEIKAGQSLPCKHRAPAGSQRRTCVSSAQIYKFTVQWKSSCALLAVLQLDLCNPWQRTHWWPYECHFQLLLPGKTCSDCMCLSHVLTCCHASLTAHVAAAEKWLPAFQRTPLKQNNEPSLLIIHTVALWRG